MMKKILRLLSYYCNALIDHLCSAWYKLLIGKVGKGTVIRRHCILDGDALGSIFIGNCCDVDTHCVLEARSLSNRKASLSEPLITIGNNCIIGQYSHITAVNKVVIGDNLLTGRFVLISDNSHGTFTEEELSIHPASRQVVSKGEVIIGNNVWLGDKVSILPGVHIGDGCIIGANAVVTHDINPYCVVVGNPGKIVKTLK